MPKSSSLDWPSDVTSTFAGLMSRCTINARCACSTAEHTCRNSSSTASSGLPSHHVSMGTPSTYSMTRKGMPSSLSPPSSRRAILGCSRRASAWRSRRNQSDGFAVALQVADELDRDLLGEGVVGALCQPDLAHAAPAQQADQSVRARRGCRAPARRPSAGSEPLATHPGYIVDPCALPAQLDSVARGGAGQAPRADSPARARAAAGSGRAPRRPSRTRGRARAGTSAPPAA